MPCLPKSLARTDTTFNSQPPTPIHYRTLLIVDVYKPRSRYYKDKARPPKCPSHVSETRFAGGRYDIGAHWSGLRSHSRRPSLPSPLRYNLTDFFSNKMGILSGIQDAASAVTRGQKQRKSVGADQQPGQSARSSGEDGPATGEPDDTSVL